MLKTFTAALALSALAVGTSYAKDVSAASDGGFRTYVQSVKACLVAANVSVTGDRPGCYMSDTKRLMCLGPYKAIGSRCDAEAKKAPEKRAEW